MNEMFLRIAGMAESILANFFARSPYLVVRDVADILLVATLIYVVLAFLKGTRAMQIAIGMGFLIGGYVLARKVGLITTWTILDIVLTYLVLIVVVIFQDDIRRGLMRVGRGPFFRNQQTAKETAVIEEVLRAANSLAAKRIGALVVFERTANLDEFIEDGTVLDAEVSKELLFTIFIPSYENPMHDGAVVVREGRIYQAGAFLPLTGTKDRSLGARHRAALGISEQTDAVVVVVSEERGALSLCFDGNIVKNIDANHLRDVLYGLFYRPRKKGADPRRDSSPRIADSVRQGEPARNAEPARASESQRPPPEPSTKISTRPARELPDAGLPEAPIPTADERGTT